MSEGKVQLPIVRSVYDNQHDILDAIVRLHCPNGFDADLTYGNGSFWKRLPRPRLCFDTTPVADGIIQADSRHLPLEPGSLGDTVFDPPFLTYVKNGRQHQDGAVRMTRRFGGYYSYTDLLNHYCGTLYECDRVMRPNAKLIVKCQDIIHNHRMHCTHWTTLGMAATIGFRLVDLFILVAKHRMPGPQKGEQRHARIWHSYFLVLEHVPKALERGLEKSENTP